VDDHQSVIAWYFAPRITVSPEDCLVFGAAADRLD
jgi:hypothetical protein